MATHVLSRPLIWIVPQEKVSLSMNSFFYHFMADESNPNICGKDHKVSGGNPSYLYPI